MAATVAAVGLSSFSDLVPVKTALVSVFDKTGLAELGSTLSAANIRILSTSGTASALRRAGCEVEDIADLTGFPEILDGRVKTLHPHVHAGLLAAPGNAKHDAELAKLGITSIDLVVVNLYPFEDAVRECGHDYAIGIENVDVGGPCMLRAGAKNSARVAVLGHPAHYREFIEEIQANSGCTSLEFRRRCAKNVFAITANYDAKISAWMENFSSDKSFSQKNFNLRIERELKYGCNPHQKPAALCSVNGAPLPFKILSGSPGYINLLDAVNSWHLVRELAEATGEPAAASFKHCSPAGAALGARSLTSLELAVYDVEDLDFLLSPPATAYLRARNGDPMSSFGDFVALSEVVDLPTALLLKSEVSDGIVAPGFEPEALEILKKKKKGNFVVLQADKNLGESATEIRVLGGIALTQQRNDAQISEQHLANQVVTKETIETASDLVVASYGVKFTQSNSITFAYNGMLIGVGAGQQSRVDCVRLAGRKAEVWKLRFHPKVLRLKENFKAGTKRQDRVNARMQYIDGVEKMSALEKELWLKNFCEEPEMFTEREKADFLRCEKLDMGVAPMCAEKKPECKDLRTVRQFSVASDAFFPFRDSIDLCANLGAGFVAQPGGSVADENVIAACDEYGIAMTLTGVRLFHH